MNAIEKLFPVSQQERSFQLKVRRDAGTAAPGWVQPQFVECKKCGRRATRQVWTKSLYVCPNCGVHLPIGAYYRLSTILDHGTFKELNPDLAPNDVLQFPGPEGSRRHRNRQDRGRAGGGSCAGQPIFYGQHEHCRGGENHPCNRICC